MSKENIERVKNILIGVKSLALGTNNETDTVDVCEAISDTSKDNFVRVNKLIEEKIDDLYVIMHDFEDVRNILECQYIEANAKFPIGSIIEFDVQKEKKRMLAGKYVERPACVKKGWIKSYRVLSDGELIPIIGMVTARGDKSGSVYSMQTFNHICDFHEKGIEASDYIINSIRLVK